MKLEDVKVGQRVKFNTSTPHNSYGYLENYPNSWSDMQVGTLRPDMICDSDGDVYIKYKYCDSKDWSFVSPACLDLIEE